MELKLCLKPGVVLPVFLGLIMGSVLFFWGEVDDAPGLCLIGIVICIGLMFIGIKNANKINKKIKPIIVLPIFFGTVGMAPLIHYLTGGIYNEPPGLIMGGLLVCAGLITTGMINIFKTKKAAAGEAPGY